MRKWDKPAPGAGATVTRRELLLGMTVLLAMAVLLAVSLTPRRADGPEAEELAQTGAEPSARLAEGCQVVQHLTYTPCGHGLTRRQALPAELYGKTRAEAEASYEPFRITSFSAEQLEMEKSLAMFCPEHMVLMPDDSGMLCIFQNRYGDALALVRELETRLADLPDSYQEELRSGKGFDSLEELEQWLESVES